ncbi:PREDICTED: serine protease snake-like [Papilio polytes]|uniref:serine protease snake-like n=1 Tax=Papilio polytes TaxID=76194 RepID=UPI000675C8F5|nr:PREDICTED: serine protease snake-like [Papilio polytes]
MNLRCKKLEYVLTLLVLVSRNTGEDITKNEALNAEFIDPLIEEQSTKLWNATTGEFNTLLDKYSDNCKPLQYHTPDFRAEGRRISEVKCMEHIWRIRYDIEERLREFASCPNRFIIEPIVIGGKNAEVGEIPHMAAIGWRGTGSTTWIFKCGGVLISEKFVLTAAHCSKVSSRDTTVADVSPKVVRFAVNILGWDRNGFPPKDVRISRIIVHDKYHAPKTYYDIALIELNKDVIFTRSFHPACLWTKDSEISGKAIVAGWGVVDTASRRTSSILQVAAVDMVPSDECNDTLKSRRNRNWREGLASHQICAGHTPGGIDACQGDSGGPLHIKFQMPIHVHFEWRMHYVVGVTSFGYGCALANTPSVFSKVSHFIDWIENIVWEKDVNATLNTNIKRH